MKQSASADKKCIVIDGKKMFGIFIGIDCDSLPFFTGNR